MYIFQASVFITINELHRSSGARRGTSNFEGLRPALIPSVPSPQGHGNVLSPGGDRLRLSSLAIGWCFFFQRGTGTRRTMTMGGASTMTRLCLAAHKLHRVQMHVREDFVVKFVGRVLVCRRPE